MDPISVLYSEPPEQAETYKPEHWKHWTARKECILYQLFLFSPMLVNTGGNCLNQLSFTAKLKTKTPPNHQHLEMITKRIEHYYSSSGYSCIHCWPYFNTFLKFLKISFSWKENCDLVVVHLGSGCYSHVSGYVRLDSPELEYSWNILEVKTGSHLGISWRRKRLRPLQKSQMEEIQVAVL